MLGTIPAVVADKIRRVMGIVRLAVPKVRALFRFFEDFVAGNTQPSAAVTAFVCVKFILTFGTVPTVFAVLVRRVIPTAL